MRDACRAALCLSYAHLSVIFVSDAKATSQILCLLCAFGFAVRAMLEAARLLTLHSVGAELDGRLSARLPWRRSQGRRVDEFNGNAA